MLSAAVAILLAGMQACQSDDGVTSPTGQSGPRGLSNGGSNETGGGSDEYCQGTVSNGTFHNVIVRKGEVCVLDGAFVHGNVLVEPGGALEVMDSKVYGNIQADGAMYVWVENTYVEGNIQLDRTFGVFEHTANRVCGSTIDGDLQLKENRAPFAIGRCSMEQQGNYVYGNLQVEDSYLPMDFDTGFPYEWALDIAYNRVYGDLQFFKNRDFRSAGGHRIFGNWVAQNLQCKENYPPPVVDENTVGGDAEDQCYMPASGY
jgi:hypothetical protein